VQGFMEFSTRNIMDAEIYTYTMTSEPTCIEVSNVKNTRVTGKNITRYLE
jgi:hypothetical protein